VTRRLLEDLAISPWVSLATNGDWLLPSPLLVDELLVGWVGVVELGELVALMVWGNVESGESLLTADDEGALDDTVVGSSIDTGASKNILS
jgi:hypothetical protein